MSDKAKDLLINIGLRFKKIRNNLDLNQGAMAEKIGEKDAVKISRLERAENLPTPNVLKRYAELGDTTVDALLSEDSEEYLNQARDKRNLQGYNRGNQKTQEANEMDFNWKIGKIIEHAPEEEAQKILGQIDLAFRKYGEEGKRDKSSKQAG